MFFVGKQRLPIALADEGADARVRRSLRPFSREVRPLPRAEKR
jgi:hypothetical protein